MRNKLDRGILQLHETLDKQEIDLKRVYFKYQSYSIFCDETGTASVLRHMRSE